MKEVMVYDGLRVELIESLVPKAAANQVVIKVEVSGTNPKDWKTWWVQKLPVNMGDDFAGTIHEVGANVTSFKPGDRVFALHQIQAPHGSYAEYAVAWDYTTCHLPLSTTYEEASTIPLAALTASLALFQALSLPIPWSRSTTRIPLLIYGGSSAVGAFAIKLAVRSNLHPIIAVAGAGSSYVSSLLDPNQGDAVIDYRCSREALEARIQAALAAAAGVRDVGFAFDAICEKGSSKVCAGLLRSDGKLAHVLPLEEGFELPGESRASLVMSGDVHGAFGQAREAKDFGYLMMKLFARGLETGWFKGHPYETVPGGLGAVGRILENLKAGKASATKYVFRIGETAGL